MVCTDLNEAHFPEAWLLRLRFLCWVLTKTNNIVQPRLFASVTYM